MKLSQPLSPIRATRILLLAATLLVIISSARAQQPPPARTTPPKVVLKLDDVVGMHPNWQKIVESVNKRGIKASFGIICNSLENPKPEYVKWLKDTKAGGRIEFWCHGYDHKQWTQDGYSVSEFWGTPLAQQKQHIERCQQLATEKMGAPFTSFGAPFNQADEKFAEVMRDDKNFKAWMYGNPKYPMGKTVLVRVGGVNIEDPIFVPSTDRLAKGMAKNPTTPYFVIQGHPPQWNAEKMVEFEKMLDYLTEQKAVFMTPTELAATLPAPGPAGSPPPPVTLTKAPGQPAAKPANAPAGVPIGENMIANGDFSQDLEEWKLDQINNTAADIAVEDAESGKRAVHITVPEAAEKRYYVQLSQKGTFEVKEGKSYTLSFRAKSTPETEIVVVMSTAKGAWEALLRQDNIKLQDGWQDYSFTVAPAHGVEAARITISGLAAKPAQYWFTSVSMKENQ